jgi:hypothetical protein
MVNLVLHRGHFNRLPGLIPGGRFKMAPHLKHCVVWGMDRIGPLWDARVVRFRSASTRSIADLWRGRTCRLDNDFQPIESEIGKMRRHCDPRTANLIVQAILADSGALVPLL